MTGVIFSIKKTYTGVAVCCHTAVLFLLVNSLELVSIPGLIQGESDIALWKLKCLWKELLIFDQLESPCYWLWLHKCTTLITAFNKLSFLPSHILCIVVQLIFSFLLCSTPPTPPHFYGKRGLRSLQGIQGPEGSRCTRSAHGSALRSLVQSGELSFSYPAKVPALAAAQEVVVSSGGTGLWGTTLIQTFPAAWCRRTTLRESL